MRTHAAAGERVDGLGATAVRHAAVGAGAAGLVTMVVGTFLPWLRSGESERNAYRAGAALRRLLDVHGLAAAGLDVLPFVGLWCAAVAASFALGFRRISCGGALLVGIVGLAVAIGALTSKADGLVSVARSGPIVTIVGATMIVSAASVLLLPGRAGSPNQEHV